MMFLQLSWMFIAAVVCTSAQSEHDRFGISDSFHTEDHGGDNSHFRDACVCLGYNPDTLGDLAVLVSYPPSLADITCDDAYVEGLVVINNADQQGTICGNGFDDNSALAVCRSLGFEYGEYIARDGNSIDFDIPVVLEEVVCPTNTSGLDRCTTHRWGDYECTSAIKVGVRCYSNDEQRLEEIRDVLSQNQPCKVLERTIQRRISDSVDFDRDWDDYVNGFGDIDGNYWMGLEEIHQLTTAHDVSLYVDIETFKGEPFTLKLQTFSVGNASSNYAWHFSWYSQSSDRVKHNNFHGDNGMMFSTRDRDNDESFCNCASDYFSGGWWYNMCTSINLNGDYEGDVSSPTQRGILVTSIDTLSRSYYNTKTVKSVEMRISSRVE